MKHKHVKKAFSLMLAFFLLLGLIPSVPAAAADGVSAVTAHFSKESLMPGETGRLYLDNIGNDVAIWDITYEYDEDKLVVDGDGTVSLKEGYTPASGEALDVKLSFDYYDGADVIFADNFVDADTRKYTEAGGTSNPNGLPTYAITNGQARTGALAVTGYGTAGGPAVYTMPEPTTGIVTAWYYDAYSDAEKKHIEEAANGTVKFGFAATHSTGTLNTNQLGVFYEPAVAADGSKTTYAYRTATSGNFAKSNVARSTGWHKLQWHVSGEGTVMYIDGEEVAKEASRKVIANLTLATNWNNQSNQSGMNLVRGSHFIDNISVVKLDANVKRAVRTVSVPLKSDSESKTYYVSNNTGNDENDGLSPETAWKSLEKVNATTFVPGDKILLDAESIWYGKLVLKGSGAEGNPIVLSKYNDGGNPQKRPVIEGNGTTYTEKYISFDAWRRFYPSGTVELVDVEYWEISGLEITNYGETTDVGRNGICVIYDYGKGRGGASQASFYAAGTMKHIYISDCYVHDVNASHPTFQTRPVHGFSGNPQGGKMGGGIGFYGPMEDIVVENCKIDRCDNEGIRNDVLAWGGDQESQFPNYMKGFKIINNYVSRVPGDAIVLSSVYGAEVKNNYVTDCGRSYLTTSTGENQGKGNEANPAYLSTSVNFAALWFIGAGDSVAEYNEVVNNPYRCSFDGMAFDADYDCNGLVYQYNYTSRNSGGFMLFMRRTRNSIVRYNLSVEDGNYASYSSTFCLDPTADNNTSSNGKWQYFAKVYNNVFILPSNITALMKTNGGDLNRSVYFTNNIVAGTDALTKPVYMFKRGSNSTQDTASGFNRGEFTNNLFWPQSLFDSISANNFSGTGTIDTSGNIAADPKFVDITAIPEGVITSPGTSGASFDSSKLSAFKLQPDSPAIGKGVKVEPHRADQNDIFPLTKDLFGNTISEGAALNIGAFQLNIMIDKQPEPMTYVKEGGILATLSVEASSSSELSYQWFSAPAADDFSGTEISGATGQAFEIPSDLAKGTYYFYCEISDEYSSTKTDMSAVIVRGANSVLFSAMADTHTGASHTGNASNTYAITPALLDQRAQKSVSFFKQFGIDAFTLAGDLTDSGTASQFNRLKNNLSGLGDIQLIASSGNHDGISSGGATAFKNALGLQPNAHYVINGYHFITLSPGEASGTVENPVFSQTSSYAYLESWAKEQLAAAREASPGKPIFVFMHHALRNSHYLSNEWYGTGLGDASSSIFSSYPEAVVFSAHSHVPNNDPRSIWQDGGFTTVNAPSAHYFELERGKLNEAGNGTSTYPYRENECWQGALVEVDGSEVTIRNYDFISGQWIDQTWSFDVTKPEEFPYTSAKRTPQAQGPVFNSGAKLSVSDITETSAAITFDQAVLPRASEAGEQVHSYKIELYNVATGALVRSELIWSGFYLIPMPEKITQVISRLSKGMEYELRVYGIGSFQQTGSAYLSTTFATVGDPVPPTKMDLDLRFEDSLNNEKADPAQVGFVGTQTYVDGKQGKAIRLNGDNYIELDNASNLIDYNQSFSIAYWINIQSTKGSDPAIMSNKNWNSGGNDGFLFMAKNNTIKLNAKSVAGSRINGYDDIEIARYTANAWVHIAATFDKETNKIITYANGEKVNEHQTDLSLGMTGNGLVSFIGQSYNTSTALYNGSGRSYDTTFFMDNFVMINNVFSAAQVKALYDMVPGLAITIDTQPEAHVTTTLGMEETLSVQASIAPEATLSYQWYAAPGADDFSGTPIVGADTSKLKIKSETPGISYYYCVVSAAGADPVKSNMSTVEVLVPEIPAPLFYYGFEDESELDITGAPYAVKQVKSAVISDTTAIKGNGSLYLAGNNNFVKVDANSFVYNRAGVAQPFTISMWINPEGITRQQFLFACDTGDDWLLLRPNGYLGSYRLGSGNDTYTHDPINSGEWTHITVSVSSTAVVYYINAVEVARTSATTWNSTSPASFFSLGGKSNNDSSTGCFTGYMDQVRFYDKTLTAAQVNALYISDYTESYTVTFNSDGGTTEADPSSITVISPAATVGKLPAPPTKTGYIFDGWYTQPGGNGEKFDETTEVTGDITVYAKWKAGAMVSVTTPAIVSTLSAYLSVELEGGDSESGILTAYLEVGGELLYPTAIVSGKGRMYIPKAPAEGSYKLVVISEQGGTLAECEITVKPYNTGIWKANAYILDGKLYLAFNDEIKLKTADSCVNIGGETYSAAVLSDGRTAEVLGLEAEGVLSGTTVAIKGVIYPELFPSYSFTFTVTVP